MKNQQKFSAFETNVGKYSNRKIPQWRLGHNELRQYLDLIDLDTPDDQYQIIIT